MAQTLNFELSGQQQAIIQCVDAFENSDVAGDVDLRSFLRDLPQEYHNAALLELVRVDLERQWRKGEPRRFTEYLDTYPELRASQTTIVDLLQDEYELRRGLGEEPNLDEYRQVCPTFTPRAAPDTDRPIDETAAFQGPAVVAPRRPDRIGKYTIRGELGAGGFGVVYQGYDEQLERLVAIKIGHQFQDNAEFADDLLNEARSIARLDHAGIVKLLEVGQTIEGMGFVVYDYIAGETLQMRIQRRDYILGEAVEWVARIAEALHYAHKRGIIHRDVKPANILIDSEGRPKILDFGLARRDNKFFMNDSGRILGTLPYTSPEQAKGVSHWASSQSDLFSLGIVLYELLCHARPFAGTTVHELLDEVCNRTPHPPRSLNDKIPKPLEDVCLKALQKAPRDRYTTGADMAAAARSALQPPKTLLPKLLRAAAAIVAISALCVLVVTLLQKNALAPAPVPLEFNAYQILRNGPQGDLLPITNADLPLSANDDLELQATFNRPVYGYLIRYEIEGGGRLLWPARDRIAKHRQDDRIIYPELGDLQGRLTLPNSSGASLIVALGSEKLLTEQEIEALLENRLTMGIAPATAATLKTRFTVADPAPKFTVGALRSGQVGEESGSPSAGEGTLPNNTQPHTRLLVPESFKKAIKSKATAYYGVFVPHQQVSASGQ